MLNRSFTLLLLITVLFSFQCRKHHISEIEKLPPVTQSGANTFGCLINGKAWMPSGFDRNPNFFIIVDPTFQNGNFDLRTYRIENHKTEKIIIFSNDIHQVGTFTISSTGNVFIDFKSEINNCYFLGSSSNFSSGFLKIDRYDMQNGIVAGEFECTLYDRTTTCDTIKITNGRFDYKL